MSSATHSHRVDLVDHVYPPTGSGQVHEITAEALQVGVNTMPFPSMNFAWTLNGVPLPTAETAPWTNNVVGTFEGARYVSSGIYRPWHNCLMRSLSRPFCPICVEENIVRFWNRVDLVDDVYPPTGSGQVHEITAEALQVGVNTMPFPSMNFAWTLNGVPLPDNSAVVSIAAEQVGDGNAALDLTISYDTDLVRKTTFSGQYAWELHSTFCCQNDGDADGNDAITIADATYLIARIFSGGPAPTCCGEGDSDGNGTLTIGDVTYLINRIFGGGSAPVCGPAGMGC
jgi:hypothetical protein